MNNKELREALAELVRELDHIDRCTRCIGANDAVDACHRKRLKKARERARTALKNQPN